MITFPWREVAGIGYDDCIALIRERQFIRFLSIDLSHPTNDQSIEDARQGHGERDA